MGANGKTVLSLQERGFIKIIVDKETDCILGAQMMCAHATDMISQFTQAIQQELTLADLQKIIFPHSTFNEAIGKGFIRASYATSVDNISGALARIKNFLDNL